MEVKMVTTLSLATKVPLNRELRIVLPDDVPTGPADVVVVVASQPASPAHTLGDLLQSEFFGMWRDRDDLRDNPEFARQLRVQAWSRAA
jgi:hypothetical protein